MNERLDALDEEMKEGAVSPVSGVGSAIAAGEGIASLPRGRALAELPVYLVVQVTWFAAFGMQTVLFPHLLKNILDVSGTLLGLGQMALAAPSVVFILIGGVVAERGDGRTLLILFHLLAALPAAVLGTALGGGALAYWMMLAYAVAMGVIGAFMMPARDAILNEVVERRQDAGSGITLQQGVAFATLAQFAAQIVGLALGGLASHVGAQPLLFLQGGLVAAGAGAAVFLRRGRMVRTGRTGVGAVFGDIADGMKAVRANPVLWSMVASMFGVGVFVIGAFLVILPIVNADVYGQNSSGLRNIFVTFWFGAFCSSAALSRVRSLARPGRMLLLAQGLGTLCIFVLARETPYPLFIGLVFVWGVAAGVSIMMSRAIVQAAAPPALLARVLSIYQLGFMGGAPIGAALLGVLADHVGPHLVILAPATGMLALILWTGLGTPIWRMTAPAAEAA